MSNGMIRYRILRFAQDFGSGLPLRSRPAKRLKFSKIAENGFGAASRTGSRANSAPNCTNQILIFPQCGLGVCDGDHK